MKDIEILSTNQEFFTIASTGESGTSLRGLARLSGIPMQSLSRWFASDLTHGSAPNELKALAGSALYLTHEIKVRGRAIKAIRADIVAEIIEYAALELGKPQAKAVLKQTNKIGTTSYLQGENGYLPEAYAESTLEPRYRITRLVRDANPWRRLYSKEVCDRVRSWYFPRDFFWKFAYGWMTQEEIDFLNEQNPVLEGSSQRADRIFQFLSQETRDRLEPEIAALCLLIETSTSRSAFEASYARRIGFDQKEIAYA